MTLGATWGISGLTLMLSLFFYLHFDMDIDILPDITTFSQNQDYD